MPLFWPAVRRVCAEYGFELVEGGVGMVSSNGSDWHCMHFSRDGDAHVRVSQWGTECRDCDVDARVSVGEFLFFLEHKFVAKDFIKHIIV